ncbi:MAG: glycosyltransferase family 39 protein [Acidobacteriota bacterium]|nr:MAG: glycosyltransferase family 39 protein [Acidobacteriota bacterium]
MIQLKKSLPLLICAVHLIVMISLARQHPLGNYATETDFYHFYGPDTGRILNGEFPVNPYQGPGYPAVLAMISGITGADFFTAGKWLSVVCAVVVGWLAFVLFSRLFGFGVGIGAQLLVILSGEFPQFSINSTTDVFFLMVCLAQLVIFTSERLTARWRLIISAALGAFAYLTRYNGLFLIAACLIGMLVFDLYGSAIRERIKSILLFLAVILIVSSPWFYANYKHRGSPFYNTNYLNMATEFYPELVDGKTNQDGTRTLARTFTSFGEVLRYDTGRILKHYPENLWASLKSTVTTTLLNRWVALGGLLGIALALIFKRTPRVTIVLLAGLFYWLLMALNHWETRYYFFIMALLAGFGVWAVKRLIELARLPESLRPAACVVLVGFLCGISLAESRRDVGEFLEAQPLELLSARDFILGQKKAGQRLRIVARKPHLPYLTGDEWIFFPQVGSIEELEKWVSENRFDYMTISKREFKERKELKPLGKVKNAPPWLKAVWVNEDPIFILFAPTGK